MNPTKRQQWAKQRNWAIFQLKGVQALFKSDLRKVIISNVLKEDPLLLHVIEDSIRLILERLQESEWEDQ